MAQGSISRIGSLIIEVLDHIHVRTHAQAVSLPLTSDQPVAEAATYLTHNRDKRRTSISNLRSKQSVVFSLRPRSQRDRPRKNLHEYIRDVFPSNLLRLIKTTISNVRELLSNLRATFSLPAQYVRFIRRDIRTLTNATYNSYHVNISGRVRDVHP